LSSGNSIVFSFVRIGPVSGRPAGASATRFRHRLAVLFGHLVLAARAGVQVAAATGGEERRRAARGLLDLVAGDPAPVGVVLVDVAAERRAVARVGEHRRERLLVGRQHAQDRYFRVHQALRVVLDRPGAVLVLEAPVHSERGLGGRPHQARRVAGRHRLLGRHHDALFEELRVLEDVLPGGLVEPVEDLHRRPLRDGRASVGVARDEHDRALLHPEALVQVLPEVAAQLRREAEDVRGHQKHDLPRAVLQRQRARKEVRLGALGRLVPVPVPRHPAQLLGRDQQLGHAGLEGRLRAVLGLGAAEEDEDGEQRKESHRSALDRSISFPAGGTPAGPRSSGR
jgi:hypothetical protein